MLCGEAAGKSRVRRRSIVLAQGPAAQTISASSAPPREPNLPNFAAQAKPPRMTMPKIAFLACHETMPGSPQRRPDAFEHDLLFATLAAGLDGRAELVEIDWRAPLDALTAFDLAYLGTPWDYTEAKDIFLERLDALEAAGVVVCNPAPVVRWNSDKLYLKDLEARGAVSIPTLWPPKRRAGRCAGRVRSFRLRPRGGQTPRRRGCDRAGQLHPRCAAPGGLADRPTSDDPAVPPGDPE